MTDYLETARALLDLADAVATDTAVIRRAEAKGINQQAIRSAAADLQEVIEVIDDADLPPTVPPLAACPVPTGVLVIARAKVVGGIDVTWNPPATGTPEYVYRARVQYRAQGSATWLEQEAHPLTGARLRGLPEDTFASPKVYEARAAFIDRYERQSAWSEIVASQVEQYIPYLAADRITSGMITTSTLTLAGTEASQNKAQMVFIGDAVMRFSDGVTDKIRLSGSGMELEPVIAEGSKPADSSVIGQAITVKSTSGDEFASLWGTRVSGGTRGFQMRADGVQSSPNVDGVLNFVATRGGTQNVGDAGYARLRVTAEDFPSDIHGVAGLTGVEIRNALRVIGPVHVSGQLVVNGKLTAPGATDLYVDAPFRVGTADFLRSTTLRGALDVYGVTTLRDDLRMAGAVIRRESLADTLFFESPVQIGRSDLNKSLDVKGTITSLAFPGSQINPRSITGSKIGENEITNILMATGSVGEGNLTDNIKQDAAEATFAARKLAQAGTAIAAAHSDHTHSIPFKNLPLRAQRALVDLRKRVRGAVYGDAPTLEQIEDLRFSVLSLMALAFDDEDQLADQHVTLMETDHEYRQSYERENHMTDYGNGSEPRAQHRFNVSIHPDILQTLS